MQTLSQPLDIEANLSRLEACALEASKDGVQLLITPEMYLSGYDIGMSVWEFSGRDLRSCVGRIAAKSGVALVVGAPEFEEGAVYNSVMLVDEGGKVVTQYRKANLFGETEQRLFSRGNLPAPVVELHGIKVALMICYDVEFPECVRDAAVRGADLVVVPTAQMRPFEFVADSLVPVRAWENQVYVAYVNYCGTERSLSYVGRSSIVGPDGERLAWAMDEQKVISCDVHARHVEEQRRINPYLLDVRADLYSAKGSP